MSEALAKPRRGPRGARPAGAIALLVLAVLAGTAPARAAEPAPAGPSAGEVRAVLASVRKGDLDVRAVEHLVRLGPETSGVLLALRDEIRRDEQIRVAAEALARLECDKLEPYLLATLQRAERPGTRRAVYAILAAHGTPFSFPHLARLMDANPPKLKRPADDAFTAILRRHGTRPAHREAWAAGVGRTPETRARIVSCLSASAAAAALAVLEVQLGENPSLDPAILCGIARLVNAGHPLASLSAIRSLLDHDDSRLRREAALILGIVHDSESLPALIEMLEESDIGVRANVHWTLRNISGLELEPVPQRWKLWLDEERAWWRAEGLDLLAQLDSPDDEEVVKAIGRLTRHPAWRHRYESRLALLSRQGDDLVGRAAKGALGRLSDPGRYHVSRWGGAGGGRTVVRGEESTKRTSRRRRRRERPEEDGGGNLILLLCGGLVVLCLVARVTGATSLDVVRGWFHRRS
jgi:hypothetical protein